MYRLFCPAQLTLNFATPVERARAPLHDNDFLRSIAPAAAHQVAAVDSNAGVVALPPVCAEYTELGIFLAERRRRLQIHQILQTRWLVLRIVGFQLEAVTVLPAQALSMMMHRVARRIAENGIAVSTSHPVAVAHHHARRTVEAVLQVVTDNSEIWQPHPTRLHRTRAGHAVALALLSHLRRDVL